MAGPAKLYTGKLQALAESKEKMLALAAAGLISEAGATSLKRLAAASRWQSGDGQRKSAKPHSLRRLTRWHARTS